MPTIFEAIGITPPEELNGIKQQPIEGTSLVYTFDSARAAERHTTQYFEMCGNRAIYKDGWMACTTPARLPWVTVGSEPSPDDFKWELYNVANDFSQANNVVEDHPEKLQELMKAFDDEAKKYNMPYRFTGTLKRFAVVLNPKELPREEKQRLQEALGRAMMAAQ